MKLYRVVYSEYSMEDLAFHHTVLFQSEIEDSAREFEASQRELTHIDQTWNTLHTEEYLPTPIYYPIPHFEYMITVNKNGRTINIKVLRFKDVCCSDSESAKLSDIAVKEIIDSVTEQTFYWSDTNLYYSAFDYKLPCNVWCENIVTNDMRNINCTLCL